MIDHLLGRPSISWRRTQVVLVIIFWFWRVLRGDPSGPRLLWIRRANRALKQYTPWQIIVSTLTGVYAVRNLDKILGLAAPEPLTNLYSPSYYRATWITTGLDAGFATAMNIRPRWLKDICSILFSIYYIVYANEADEKLRKFRAAPTVEMLRTTWEKTTNPYIRMMTLHPRISIRRKILLARPKDSTQRRPITTWLFFAPPADQLASATDLILDFPGGGFVSMTPEHHEERLRLWAIRSGKPVLSVDYGKAPEYPYPYSIDECFDLYRVLVETTGMGIGMSGHALNIILTGDSAGAHIAVTVMFKILQTQMNLPHPLALVLNYAALDFNFTSWMTPQNLRVLQTEQSSGHLSLLPDQKDHLGHISPLSMVGDRRPRRRRSLRDTLRQLTSPSTKVMPPLRTRHTSTDVRRVVHEADSYDEGGEMGDDESPSWNGDQEKPLRARIRFNSQVDVKREVESPVSMDDAAPTTEATSPIGTRLTMTSRTGYFQDRIISPSMMRAMAILYIGPHRNPDFQSDYQLSPILAPDHLLAQFPPLLMTCGEKDPFVDDTLVFAGRVREAKRARRAELERIIAGTSSQYRESLRMSASVGVHDPSVHGDLRALHHERERLAAETEEDWVRMVIFSEWSHGYLQMPTLMPEVRGVIDDLADWMDELFSRAHDAPTSASGAPGSMFADAREAGIPTAVSGDLRGASHPSLASPRARRFSKTQTKWSNDNSRERETDGFTSTTSETEQDTDDGLTFAPRRRSPPLSYADMRRNSTASNATVRRASMGHGRTPSQSSKVPSPPTATPNGVNGDLRSGILHEVPTPLRDVEVLRQSSPPKRPTSTPGNGNAPTPSKALQGGQTITESELMRRRRLLDSHLISRSQDSVK
ncbi:alpha/beta-hydrolase [Polyporus arcularius HHB13444]|uniref:Alpha/beta-hydrolase n=1 Tax=Polyporus arcularius HHB13444 TaxID=1314778 RepID=A0A5C3PW47_9APHY|nr:alpha/beta-hydrolase [Polyporus arcularius HHB13444]